MSNYNAIFKAYDVRGTVPDQFNASMATAIGAAFARFALQEDPTTTRVLVARDMRPSGVEMVSRFAEGVTSQGLDVVDLGLGSTDLLYFAAGSLNAPGAMFTASHNPAQYNGIKFCLSGARPVGEESGLFQIRDWASEGVAAGPRTGTVSQQDLLAEFADHVRGFVDVKALKPLTGGSGHSERHGWIGGSSRVFLAPV
jgi:phosphomannomutase